MERKRDKKGKLFLAAMIGLSAIFAPIVSAGVSAKENIDTYNWTREDVSNLSINDKNTAPMFNKDELVNITSDSYIWDTWPLQEKNGHPAT
jgi:levansucrase